MQDKLQQLKEMFDKGLISKEVYDEQQKALLSNFSASNTASQTQGGLLDPKKNFAVLYKLAIFAGVVLFGIFLMYNLSDKEGKDSINEFASQTGIGTQVIPWSDRADTAARNFIAKNQSVLEQAIQGITHPTGKEPSLTAVTIDKFEDHILVNMTVSWKGGFIGNSYETTVTWDIGQTDHRSAEVTSDSADIAIDAENKQILDNAFRTKLYPAFYSFVGE